MKRITIPCAALLGAMTLCANAEHYVLGEQLDVSKVVRGQGQVTLASAAGQVWIHTASKGHHRAIRTPVPFSVEIPIGGSATTFEASVGADRTGPAGKIALRLLGDGRELWASGEIDRDAKKEIAVKVDVRGVKALTLEADAVGGSGEKMGAVWGDVRLAYPDRELPPNDVRKTSRQLGVLTPRVRKEPRVNGARVYGVRPNHPVLYRVPATGASPLKVEVLGLDDARLNELKYDPATRILSGRVSERGDYALTIRASNALGCDEKPFVLKVGERIALTPALGWNSWNCFSRSVTADKVKAAADAMITSGLADHGWAYVNVDDYWQNNATRGKTDPTLAGPARDAEGRIVSNARFPSMRELADYVHAKGLKVGLYSSPGPTTCGGCYGSWQHEEQDAQSYAEWGFDYLKHDWCSYGCVATGTGLERAMKPYEIMGRALARQNRDINYSLCQYGCDDVSKWGSRVGAQSWRTTGDVFDTWASVMAGIAHEKEIFDDVRPGAWNDMDMLCVGPVVWNDYKEPRLAPNEQYSHMSLWALAASPLMIGCDLTKLDDFTFSLLANDEVLEIDQDPLGLAAGCIDEGDTWEVWARPLADGSVAAGLFNKSAQEQTVRFDLDKAGLLCKWRVRDVWRQEDVSVVAGAYEATVPGHATHLIRLTPLPCGKLRDGMRDVRDNARRGKAAARPVFRATEHGVAANVATSQSAALAALLKKAPDGSEVVFPAGAYFLKTAVAVTGRTNLVLRGEAGARLVLHFTSDGPVKENNSAFHVNDSKGLRFENLAITTDNPPNCAGRIVALDPAHGTYDVRIDDEFPITGWEHFWGVDTCDDEGMPDYALETYEQVKTINAPDGKGGTRKKMVGTRYEVIGHQLIRVTAPNGNKFDFRRFRLGHRILFRYIIYGATVFGFGNSQDVVLRDIEIERCASFGATLSPGSANFTFERFNMRSPRGSGALYCANADGIHVVGMTGYFKMIDCHFDGLGDDCLNVHAKAGEVGAFDPKTGDVKCICRDTRRNVTRLPRGWANAGDTLIVYDPKTLHEKGRVRVTSYDSANGNGRFDVGGVALAVGDVLGNDRDFPTVEIRNCTFRNTRARGILLQSRNMTIDGCLFEGLALPGVLIAPDICVWNEIGPTVNTEIRNCTFRKCAMNGSRANLGAISVKASHDSREGTSYPAGVHRDVRIVGNRFDLYGNSGVYVASTDGVVVKGNTFARGAARRHDEKDPRTIYAIRLKDCAREHVSDNTTDKAADLLLLKE